MLLVLWKLGIILQQVKSQRIPVIWWLCIDSGIYCTFTQRKKLPTVIHTE
jgi:hypothetical protein